VSVFYDPMLAKLIVRGADREAARLRLLRALGAWQTVGAPTNVPFLSRVTATPAFAAGEVHTAFIEQHKALLLPESPPPPEPHMVSLAALCWLTTSTDALRAGLPAHSPFGAFAFGRLEGGLSLAMQPLDEDGAAAGDALSVSARGDVDEASKAEAHAGAAFVLRSGEQEQRVSLLEWEPAARRFRALVDGRSVTGQAVLQPAGADDEGSTVTVFSGDATFSVQVQDALQQSSKLAGAAGGAGAVQRAVHSPMPGKVVKLVVGEGASVKAGDPLVILEAMKMEHTLTATGDAVVKGVHAAEGDQCTQRQLLLSLEPAGEAKQE